MDSIEQIVFRGNAVKIERPDGSYDKYETSDNGNTWNHFTGLGDTESSHESQKGTVGQNQFAQVVLLSISQWEQSQGYSDSILSQLSQSPAASHQL